LYKNPVKLVAKYLYLNLSYTQAGQHEIRPIFQLTLKRSTLRTVLHSLRSCYWHPTVAIRRQPRMAILSSRTLSLCSESAAQASLPCQQ